VNTTHTFRPRAEALESRIVPTAGPHPDDPTLLDEHQYVEHLASHANVFVRTGQVYDVSGTVDLRGQWLAVESGGKVTLDSPTDKLLVDSVFVLPGGIFEATAGEVVFTDTGPIDVAKDPRLMSRGLISHGTVRIHGKPVTDWLPLVGAKVGDKTLTTDGTPSGWQAGDRLVLTGTARGGEEVVTVASVAGSAVTLTAPLARDHTPPEAGLRVHAGHLTRSVTFRSENTADLTRRGHVMFMHSHDVVVENAAFVGLGRTDKSQATGPANPLGRYPVHFHHTGVAPDAPAVRVEGSVVEGGPGWGFVLHQSRGDFTSNVAYDVLGAGFVAEDGNEVGTFAGNLAVYAKGSGRTISEGASGHGFWSESPGITMTGNVAAGTAGAAFIHFPGEETDAARFLLANVPGLEGQTGAVAPAKVAPFPFADNTAYASRAGLELWSTSPSYGPKALAERFTGWNLTHFGVDFHFANEWTIRDFKLVAARAGLYSKAFGIKNNPPYSVNLAVLDTEVRGWPVGLLTPVKGDNRVEGGVWDNVVDFQVESGATSIHGTHIRFSDDLADETFRLLHDIRADRLHTMYEESVIVTVGDRQLYFAEQAPSYVPFPLGTAVIPVALIGLTNQQIADRFGLRPLGALVPAGAQDQGGYFAGNPAPAYPPARLLSASRAKAGSYAMKYLWDGMTTQEAVEISLAWNLLTRERDGTRYTVLVYGI
jgi:hypothetical protein